VYDLYLRLEEDVLKKRPDVVVIWIGVNDVWHKTILGTGTDADKFEKFYTAIINKLK
jgi:lysophospholipase L1-like esterase